MLWRANDLFLIVERDAATAHVSLDVSTLLLQSACTLLLSDGDRWRVARPSGRSRRSALAAPRPDRAANSRSVEVDVRSQSSTGCTQHTSSHEPAAAQPHRHTARQHRRCVGCGVGCQADRSVVGRARSLRCVLSNVCNHIHTSPHPHTGRRARGTWTSRGRADAHARGRADAHTRGRADAHTHSDTHSHTHSEGSGVESKAASHSGVA